MPEPALNVLAVVGSLNRNSVTRIAVTDVAEKLRVRGSTVDVLDFFHEPLALFNPDSVYDSAPYKPLQERVERADVYLLGTPDYHGSMSSAIKNFLDHFWQEFAGKLFATIVSSHEKGLTVTDQLRTVARQCYAWSLPYGVSFSEREDLKDGQVGSEFLKKRLEMFAHDIRVYGETLAKQRRADLSGNEPGFLARYRPK
ncbi:MAG TPA: NAD(P)H-dependent oxidoreductase [Methylomirabilota bacterium]|nr:NAD(P)H-dependent oxidoreductase [Methylomirabilota bacterium]